jgi:hypothetical protein
LRKRKATECEDELRAIAMREQAQPLMDAVLESAGSLAEVIPIADIAESVVPVTKTCAEHGMAGAEYGTQANIIT